MNTIVSIYAARRVEHHHLSIFSLIPYRNMVSIVGHIRVKNEICLLTKNIFSLNSY